MPHSSSRATRLRRTLTGLLVAGVALLGGTGIASADAVLKASDPPEGATLATPPAAVSLTFNQQVNAKFLTVKVTDPAGKEVNNGAPTATGPVVTQQIQALTVPGAYTIVYRVVSADGHPVSGKRTFTLAPPAATAAEPSSLQASSAAPTSPAAPPTPAASQDNSGDSGFPVWPLLLGVAVLLLGGVAFVLLRNRPDSSTKK
ncbi:MULTISPECIES: copper resistance CopC family protein [unclassified Crossiella]|uniref:copper resistance CopC family protein n=1 Tax=unclassified Crossiella TaxID=2620835 RepID=UPI001FFEFA9C|nr:MULTISPECIES: copper resistance CopC family protein [unclassified Crossiella]MCK2240649.1 copper resistance protein CopC [Crossiella sp. S99.2]MCK2252900.1 copper resistance protein CopC [Crossiella sp. S99.1]